MNKLIEAAKANKKAIIRTSLIIGGTVAGLVLTAIVLKKVGDSDVEDLGAEALEA